MLIFVYGTLKRGGTLHHAMRGQHFVADAHTAPAYRLYNLGWYPGLVESATDGRAIRGEVWEVDANGLVLLDEIEEVDSGLYARRRIQLAAPFHDQHVMAWFFLGDTAGCKDCGEVW